MAFGLIASAAAAKRNAKIAESAADWLVAHAHPSPAVSGWADTAAWDAFQDGSINPVSTIYGITVATAAQGLMDAYDLTGRPEYLAAARDALSYYKSFFTYTAADAGFFWYSDQPVDDHEVYNVSSMLAGAYARASVLVKSAEFRRIADAAALRLTTAAESYGGLAWWRYGPGMRGNDSVHAALTVDGLVAYDTATGANALPRGALKYLKTFLRGDRVAEFSAASNDAAPIDLALPARLWGAGMLVSVLAKAGHIGAARLIANAIRSDYGHGGRLNSLPRLGFPQISQTSFAILGFAHLESAAAP